MIEFELFTNHHDRKVLNTKLEVGRHIYNTCLGEARKRIRAVLADKKYRSLVADKNVSGRMKRLKETERSYGYSEYQLHEWSAGCKHHFEGHLGINEVQKLATRAFKAMEKIHYRQARKVHFKSKEDDLSVENKSNATGLRLKDHHIVWGKLKLALKMKAGDEYAHLALMDQNQIRPHSQKKNPWQKALFRPACSRRLSSNET
ncbi:hypothetical protein QS257_12540 [Terrilactibacillus sp. S3-3]|nr:hypothetical protein QS257_12540 [Terrilactibacillus sp. S3-3]